MGWGEDTACVQCTDTKRSCVCSTHFLSPLQLSPPPWRDRVQFSTLSQIIIISAIACDGSSPWGGCSCCRRHSKMFQMMLCAILAVHSLHWRNPHGKGGRTWCIYPSENHWICVLGVVQILASSPLPSGLALYTCPGEAAFQFKHFSALRDNSSVSICTSLTLWHCWFPFCPDESLTIKTNIHHSTCAINQETVFYSVPDPGMGIWIF